MLGKMVGMSFLQEPDAEEKMMKLEGVMEKLKGLDPKTFGMLNSMLEKARASSRQLTHCRVGCPACCSPLPNSPLPTGVDLQPCRRFTTVVHLYPFHFFFEAAVLNVRAILASWFSQPRLRTHTYSGTKD